MSIGGIKVHRFPSAHHRYSTPLPIAVTPNVITETRSIIPLTSGLMGNAKLISKSNYITLGHCCFEETQDEITDNYTLQDLRGMAILVPVSGRITYISTFIDFIANSHDVIFELWKSSTFKDYKMVFQGSSSSTTNISVSESDSIIVTVRQSSEHKILRPTRIKVSLTITS